MTISDDELKKLLADIAVPEPDENEKLAALNLSQRRFEEISQKNAKTHQGNEKGARLMDVIKHNIFNWTGVTTMKKAYVIGGGLAIGALAFSLLTTTGLYDSLRPQSLNESFSQTSKKLVTSDPAITPAPAQEAEVSALYDGRNDAPQVKAKELAKREMKASGNVSADMAQSIASGSAPVAAPSAPAPMMAESRAMMGGMVANSIAPHEPYIQQQQEYFGNDKFEKVKDNPVKVVKEEPVSTFSVDVDTASYSVVRNALTNGYLPPKDAVRVEELINYFDYDYAVPASKDEPFQPTVAVYETPWNPDTQLVHIGIKGHELPKSAERPNANLVFLLDTSGSMDSADKLPLLKNAFRMLVDTLGANDTVSIVTYAGSAGTVLEPTKASEKAKILAALDNLSAGGGTAGGEGIRQAYNLAEANFQKGGVNRILLATDGDFNVGINDPEELKGFVERKRDTGIYLSVLGFGRGNYNDALMQKLAQNGNGNAAYIDSLNEARKVLVDEATSTLYPIAGDVKIQVEFNPLAVAEYRLIGYETRMLNREDFNNDKVDAGDIGAGHTVTAIYEVTPTGSKAKLVDDLRYGNAVEKTEEAKPTATGNKDEIAFLKIRYKLPGESESKLISREITQKDKVDSVEKLSDDVRFAGAVAAFGQLLRNDTYTQKYSFDDVLKLAQSARGEDTFGYRSEFLNLVRLAKTAQDQQAQPNGGQGYYPYQQ